MSAQQLAGGYGAYVSADEVIREAAEPMDAALRDPTTSILTTICIHGVDRDED